MSSDRPAKTALRRTTPTMAPHRTESSLSAVRERVANFAPVRNSEPRPLPCRAVLTVFGYGRRGVLFLQELPHKGLPVPETHVVLPGRRPPRATEDHACRDRVASGAGGGDRSGHDQDPSRRCSCGGTRLGGAGAGTAHARFPARPAGPLRRRAAGRPAATAPYCDVSPWWSDATWLPPAWRRWPRPGWWCALATSTGVRPDTATTPAPVRAEFFDRSRRAGSLTSRPELGRTSERATRQAPAYQVDRVLVDAGAATRGPGAGLGAGARRAQ